MSDEAERTGFWDWFERQQQRALDAQIRRGRVRAPLSGVGIQTPAGLACPRCGGTQFKARRSKKARAVVVATGMMAAAVTHQKRVDCIACGARFGRG